MTPTTRAVALIAVAAVAVVLVVSLLTTRGQRYVGVTGSEYEIVSTPTNAQEADRQVLDNMLSNGADLSRETTVLFFLELPNQGAATGAARHIDSLGGFTVKYAEDPADSRWLCIATRRMSLDGTTLFEHSDLFEGIAAEYGGSYDGWEAEVVK